MLMPSIFGETLLDDFWGFPMRDNYMRTANTNGLMQTDVEEKDDGYEITMNLPGFKKEDVSIRGCRLRAAPSLCKNNKFSEN